MVKPDDLVIAVCDIAYEHLPAAARPRVHWSVPDPASTDTDAAFEAAYDEIAGRIDRLAPLVSREGDCIMTEVARYHREDLSIDQQLALRTAATRLREQFAAFYGAETIERFLHSSYDQFATGSTIPNFLPLLAERFARQRLTALAKVEGSS